jgi:hypothetical protein
MKRFLSVVVLFFTERSNCFFVAWYLWFKRGNGYCAIRRTRPPLPWGWHWVYIPNTKKLRVIHYEPITRKDKLVPALIHKIWFKGRLRRYDNPWKGPK